MKKLILPSRPRGFASHVLTDIGMVREARRYGRFNQEKDRVAYEQAAGNISKSKMMELYGDFLRANVRHEHYMGLIRSRKFKDEAGVGEWLFPRADPPAGHVSTSKWILPSANAEGEIEGGTKCVNGILTCRVPSADSILTLRQYLSIPSTPVDNMDALEASDEHRRHNSLIKPTASSPGRAINKHIDLRRNFIVTLKTVVGSMNGRSSQSDLPNSVSFSGDVESKSLKPLSSVGLLGFRGARKAKTCAMAFLEASSHDYDPEVNEACSIFLKACRLNDRMPSAAPTFFKSQV